jgi:hypothetical protein
MLLSTPSVEYDSLGFTAVGLQQMYVFLCILLQITGLA